MKPCLWLLVFFFNLPFMISTLSCLCYYCNTSLSIEVVVISYITCWVVVPGTVAHKLAKMGPRARVGSLRTKNIYLSSIECKLPVYFTLPDLIPTNIDKRHSEELVHIITKNQDLRKTYTEILFNGEALASIIQ